MLPDHTCPDIDEAQSVLWRLHWRVAHAYRGRIPAREILRLGIDALERLRDSNRALRREVRMATRKQLYVIMYAAEALEAQTQALLQSVDATLGATDPLTADLVDLVAAVSDVLTTLRDRVGHSEH